MAESMLGVSLNPYKGQQDEWLKQTAEKMGSGDSFETVPQGIYFGDPHQWVSDPLLNGQGPERIGCNQCGNCITGVRRVRRIVWIKTIYILQRTMELRLFQKLKITHPSHVDGKYIIHTYQSFNSKEKQDYSAKQVILSAGVIGTVGNFVCFKRCV